MTRWSGKAHPADRPGRAWDGRDIGGVRLYTSRKKP